MYPNSFACGIFIALISCLPGVSCRGNKCFDNSDCRGQFGNMRAVCEDGYCVCTGQHYDYNTCLPDVHGCKIVMNADTGLAKPRYKNRQSQPTYSCTPDNNSTQYEVHVLSVFEGNSHSFPPRVYCTVTIVSDGKPDRPIILVLGSQRAVTWIINKAADITISEVILVPHYVDESSVSGVGVPMVKRKNYRWSWGYGNDTEGGDSVGLLKKVYRRFGVVTSFTGSYLADEWTLFLSSYGSNAATTTPVPLTTLDRQTCSSNYCPGGYKMNAVCRDGYCVCTREGYDYNTCLPDTCGCKIVVNDDTALAKLWYNSQRQTAYSCKPGNSSTHYEVHVLSMYEVVNTRPPTAGNATVNITSPGSSDRPIVLVLASYEPVNWILSIPANITICKVILLAYYVDKSSVTGVGLQKVERKSYQWGWGVGSDFGGGDTVTLLNQVHNRFGVVTSFTGTYKADEWSLVLPLPKARPSSSCQDYACLLMAVQKLGKTVKQLKEEMKSQHERVTALEQLEKNRGSQNHQQDEALYSSGMSTYRTMEKVFGVFVISSITLTKTY